MPKKGASRRHYNKKYYADKLEKVLYNLRMMGEPGAAIVEKYTQNKDEHPKKTLQKVMRAYVALKLEIEDQIRYKEPPVDIETFVTDKYYLNMKVKPHMDEDGDIYPEVLNELKKICAGDYIEVVCTGSIGSAKTTLSLILLAYHLYLLSVLRDPHKEYSLLKSDEIVMIFQSLNAAHAKTVDYARFKAMITNSRYFQEKFMYDKNIDSEMQFPNRIIVKPISGSATAAIGQNCISGLIDEINFMKITEKSKNKKDSGTFDQAKENYQSIVRRRESRFMKMGRTPGILCLVSSKRYPGEFTDKKIEEAKTNDKIYIYDKRVWDISPPGRFSGETFKVFAGDLTQKPRVLLPHEEVPEEYKHLIEKIPIEYKKAFEDDILGSLRDIAGRSTLALEPFIIDVERVAEGFGSYQSILSRDDCDFVTSKVYIYPNRIRRKEQSRFVHVDLGLVNDCAGVACGYVAGFVNITRGEGEEQTIETLPVICYDFILEVRPPPNGEISFYKIRDLIYKLGKVGLNVKWVTLDSWQAIDTIQILRRKGYKTGIQSMDTSVIPYEITKTAFMDRRVHAPEHVKGHEEFISLEKDVKKGKIDHSPNGSKDVSDAIAGVCFGLTMRREIWLNYGIPLMAVPQTLKESANTAKNSIDQAKQEA